MKNDNKTSWTLFHFQSDSNPYIAKTEKEKQRILKKYNCLFIEEDKNKYFILDKCLNSSGFEANQDIIDLVSEELERYVNDEVGQESKEKYENLTEFDKISLFYNALQYSDKIRNFSEFTTDLVINFDYNNF